MTKTLIGKKYSDKEKLQEKLKIFAQLIVDRLLEEKNKGILKAKA